MTIESVTQIGMPSMGAVNVIVTIRSVTQISTMPSLVLVAVIVDDPESVTQIGAMPSALLVASSL